MKIFSSFSQLALTATLASGVVLGAMMPSEACPFSKMKGTELGSTNPLKTTLNNLDIKQVGLLGAGVLFLGGVAAAGFLSQKGTPVSDSDEWEVSQFSIPVPPEALNSTVAEEEAEEYTSVG
jgi:hypothetical protein